MTEKPPAVFSRPTDAPEPLPAMRASEEVVQLHTEWARAHEAEEGRSLGARLRYRASSVAARFAVDADNRLLGDLIRAVDAVAARVDDLSERVNCIATTTDDLARSLSEEVTQLRADVQRMAAGEPGDPTPPSR